MKIQILGTGCAKCKTLAEATEAAATAAGIDFVLEKVTDIKDIMSFKVMMTPAVVIDGEVKCTGKIPTAEEFKDILGV